MSMCSLQYINKLNSISLFLTFALSFIVIADSLTYRATHKVLVDQTILDKLHWDPNRKVGVV